MYKATLTLAFLAIAKLALAGQPACLLAAVNKFDHPADQQTLCTKQADKVASAIESVCSSGNVDAAKKAFKDACDQANYSSGNSTSSASSSVSGSKTKTGTGSGSKSTGLTVYTTTYYDKKCSCTKTSTISSSYAAASTGFATGTAPVATGTSPASPGGAGGAGGSGSGAAATGSPITPATGATGTPSGNFAGAANQNVVSGAGALFALGALVMML